MGKKEIFYHGTCRLFDKFSLSHLGEGEGKSKYGRAIYLTSSYATAALYASKAAKANGVDTCYVYTVEVPELTEDNHLFSCKPVVPVVVERAEAAINENVPDEAKVLGKYFRKYLGNLLAGQRRTVKQMIGKADAVAEDAVAGFLNSIGVFYLAWPHAQTKPDGDTNRALLNEAYIDIVKIEQVDVDAKNKLINGSQREVQL